MEEYLLARGSLGPTEFPLLGILSWNLDLPSSFTIAVPVPSNTVTNALAAEFSTNWLDCAGIVTGGLATLTMAVPGVYRGCVGAPDVLKSSSDFWPGRGGYSITVLLLLGSAIRSA